jgi:hypothetical protein
MNTKKSKGMCDSCGDITYIHKATNDEGSEWWCETCDPLDHATIVEVNGRTYITGLGL